MCDFCGNDDHPTPTKLSAWRELFYDEIRDSMPIIGSPEMFIREMHRYTFISLMCIQKYAPTLWERIVREFDIIFSGPEGIKDGVKVAKKMSDLWDFIETEWEDAIEFARKNRK